MERGRKILILSYFYPPCPLTAAQRIGSFVKHLPAHGYYPIVITRNWQVVDQSPAGLLADCGGEDQHYHEEDHEVYYLPYRSSLRDRLFAKSKGSRTYRWLSKGLTLLSQLGQNISNAWIPYSNLYKKAQLLMQQDDDIRILLISGNPFESFRFGYLLRKEFRDLKWFADYRDAWTSSTIHPHLSTFPWKQINMIQSFYERKWVGSATGLISVSEPLVEQLSGYTNIPGQKVENGFEEIEFLPFRGLQKYEAFTITYVGTLYPGQEIEFFFDALRSFLSQRSDARICLKFPGLGYDQTQVDRVNQLTGDHQVQIDITGRVAKEQVLEIQGRSHLLLYVGWKGHKGIIASKVYEYLASSTKILLAPSDDGEVARMIENSNGGYIIQSMDECVSLLERLYKGYLEKDTDLFTNSGNAMEIYTRESQAAELASFIRKSVE